MSDERDLPPGDETEVGAFDDGSQGFNLQRFIDTARRGVQADFTDANLHLLLEVTFPHPQPVALVCLADANNATLRYVIQYGAGGIFRQSIGLLPGVWYCGGDRIRVSAIQPNAGNACRAGAFWYYNNAAHNIP